MNCRDQASSAVGDERSGVEALLREHTDAVERAISILAIAPEPAVERILARLPRTRCRRAPGTSSAALRFDAETFDVAIADMAAIDPGAGAPLRELARMLRPGGRLILSVTAGAAAGAAQRLATAGFLVARAGDGRDSTVLLGIRGEFAAYAS